MADLIVEVHYLPNNEGVQLIVPKQPGIDFPTASAKLQAFSERLKIEAKLPVEILGLPEMHTHGPDDVRAHNAAHQHR